MAREVMVLQTLMGFFVVSLGPSPRRFSLSKLLPWLLIVAACNVSGQPLRKLDPIIVSDATVPIAAYNAEAHAKVADKFGGDLGFHYLLGDGIDPSYEDALPYAQKAARIGVRKIRLFDYSEPVLRALLFAYKGQNLSVIVNLPNHELNNDAADHIVAVANNFPEIVKGIYVSTEPCFNNLCNGTNGTRLLQLLRNITVRLPNLYVTIPFANAGVLKNTVPVKDSEFKDPDFMRLVLQYLNETDNPLVVNVYPYLDRLHDPGLPLAFALGNGRPMKQEGFTFVSQFDADVRCMRAAVRNLGGNENFEQVPLWVSEVGWATSGKSVATRANAQLFYDTTVTALMAGRWDDIGLTDIYAYELFDEPYKPLEDLAGISAHHWGLYGLRSPWSEPIPPIPSPIEDWDMCDVLGPDFGSSATLAPAWFVALVILLSFLIGVLCFVKSVARNDTNRRSKHRSQHFDMKSGDPTTGDAQPYSKKKELDDLRCWAQRMEEYSKLFAVDEEKAELLEPKPRTEDLYRFVAFYRESAEEVRDTLQSVLQWPRNGENGQSLRFFSYVDGLQKIPGQTKEQATAALTTLHALAKVLPLGQPRLVRGCVVFMGQAEPSGVPFEIYVKGPCVPRTKWESQVEFIAILAADVMIGHEPKAVMLGDGDCNVDVRSVELMYKCVREDGFGGAGPYLNAANIDTPISLHAGMRYWMQAVECRGLSAAGFHYPLYGPCQMWSMKALKAMSSEYTALLRGDSLWDNSQVLNGEDGFATVCCHSAGFKIKILPNAFATIYVPDSPLDYLAQQCRWRLGECSNLDLNYCRSNAWHGLRCLFWPQRIVEATFCEAPLGASMLTLSGSFIIEMTVTATSLFDGPHASWAPRVGLQFHTCFWALLTFYAIAAAGAPVKSNALLNGTVMAIMYILGLVFPLLLVYLVIQAQFCWLPWRLIVINIIVLRPLCVWGAQLKHQQPWPWAVLLFWYQGLAYWVDTLQAPLLAVGSVEGAGGWGTRTSGDDAARSFPKPIINKRRKVLTLWLLANYAVGALALAFGCAQALLAIVFSCQLLENWVFLSLGVVYTLMQPRHNRATGRIAPSG